jgi:16S rRNA U516 pseudouridylate synthase RsuA-like enzyme
MTTLAERLHADFPGSSGRSVKQWLSAGRVRVNAEVVRDPRTLVAPGDRVTLGPGVVDPAHPAVLPLGLAIVHEDRHLVVIDKPPGLLTIATEKERERTAYRLLWDLLGRHRPVARPFIVHRLDRETSGLLVVAKTPGAKTALQTQFAARTVDRGYVAVVEGVMRKDTRTLVDRVEEDAAYRVRIARAAAAAGARPSPATACAGAGATRRSSTSRWARAPPPDPRAARGHRAPRGGRRATRQPARSPPPRLPARLRAGLRPSRHGRARALREPRPARLPAPRPRRIIAALVASRG